MRGAWTAFLSGALLLMAPAARAQSTYTNADGSIYTYTVNSDSSITISAYAGPPWGVTVPASLGAMSVSGIGFEAFAFDSVTNVTISSGISSIGNDAFVDCVSLAGVTIPGSVSSIGLDAFAGCTKLASLTISNGVPSIGEYAFYYCTSLGRVVFPGSVTSIGEHAFQDCYSLANVYFLGGPPAADSTAFPTGTTVYYVTDTNLWGPTFAGRAPLLWNAMIQTGDGNFGVQSNQFGFDVAGTTNIVVVVEGCTNLAGPVWSPLGSLTLSNGLSYFSEPLQTNIPGRYYRLSSP
jgi:hypothetical protein